MNGKMELGNSGSCLYISFDIPMILRLFHNSSPLIQGNSSAPSLTIDQDTMAASQLVDSASSKNHMEYAEDVEASTTLSKDNHIPDERVELTEEDACSSTIN